MNALLNETLNKTNFRSLQYSTLISLIGDELTNMAILTLIYNTTKSASLVASVFIFRTLAIFFLDFSFLQRLIFLVIEKNYWYVSMF